MALVVLAACGTTATSIQPNGPSPQDSQLTTGLASRVSTAQFPPGIPLSVVPPDVGVRRLHLKLGRARPLNMKPPKGGLYGSVWLGPKMGQAYAPGNVYGYASPNTGNNPPACTIIAESVNGFGVDPYGNTMVPGYFFPLEFARSWREPKY